MYLKNKHKKAISEQEWVSTEEINLHHRKY
jgi:hypothetical protein